MRIVAALGGNALLPRGEVPSFARQQANIRKAVVPLARIADAHELVITHGNGPQLGLLALLQADVASGEAFPLDVLGAETEGMIGYMIAQELSNHCTTNKEIATLLTRTEVDPEDPSFESPAKPIGPVVSKQTAARMARDHGWSFGPDGPGFRRLLPSPAPRRIIEQSLVSLLLGQGATVICAGGGGVPVSRAEDGRLDGVEAVVDKDLASALLASGLDAAHLLLLTDVDAVYDCWDQPAARAITQSTPTALRKRSFARGTMGPKVEAACRFVEATGGKAAIGRLEDAAALLDGTAGTQVTP
jgi:carbamate kinase